jgi:hypothetical protein
MNRVWDPDSTGSDDPDPDWESGSGPGPGFRQAEIGPLKKVKMKKFHV